MDKHFRIIETFVRETCQEHSSVSAQMAVQSLELIKKYIDGLCHEIATGDKLLAEQNRLLKSIPACPAHGETCIPHAIEWVKQVKTLGEVIFRNG